MAYIIQDKVTGYICGEYFIKSTEELRKIEKDYNVIHPETESEKED